jgi:hypothetical protein
MFFLKPDSGRVIVAGEDITDYNEERLELIHEGDQFFDLPFYCLWISLAVGSSSSILSGMAYPSSLA